MRWWKDTNMEWAYGYAYKDGKKKGFVEFPITRYTEEPCTNSQKPVTFDVIHVPPSYRYSTLLDSIEIYYNDTVYTVEAGVDKIRIKTKEQEQ